MCNDEMVMFPTTLGVNAFRGFLNEFLQFRSKRRGSNKSKQAKTSRSKRRKSDVTLHNGHRFNPGLVHIPTYCEVCNLFMWHAEKIFVCLNCRLSCHRKCHTKVASQCPKAPKMDPSSNLFFGADLNNLIDDDTQIPILLDKFVKCILEFYSLVFPLC
jgi:myosin-9